VVAGCFLEKVGGSKKERSRSEQKNAWSRFVLKLLKLQTKFGKLIFGKIIKIVATRCHILKLKCTELDFGWGCAPDLAGGAYRCNKISPRSDMPLRWQLTVTKIAADLRPSADGSAVRTSLVAGGGQAAAASEPIT